MLIQTNFFLDFITLSSKTDIDIITKDHKGIQNSKIPILVRQDFEQAG